MWVCEDNIHVRSVYLKSETTLCTTLLKVSKFLQEYLDREQLNGLKKVKDQN